MRWPFNTQQARRPRERITVPGWVPRDLRKILQDLDSTLASTIRRKAQGSLPNVPSAIKGERIFLPDTAQTRTVAAVSVNDVIKSGQTYDIEVPHNASGIFVARGITVSIACRRVLNGAVLWQPCVPQNADLEVNVTTVGPDAVIPLSYMWGLSDPRSGKRFSSDLMSCFSLLYPTKVDAGFRESYMPGSMLKFDAPWVMERDSQFQFAFRPITNINQTAGQDLDHQVRVRVEVHGTRYFTDQDMLRKGARV